MDPLSIELHTKDNTIKKFDLPFNQSHDVEFNIKKLWKETIVNVGHPINSVAWAYRGR